MAIRFLCGRGTRVAAAVVAAVVAGSSASAVNAGTYRAAQCHAGHGAGHQDAIFARTSDHYRSSAECAEGGAGLSVSHDADSTATGRWGAWTLAAPAGTDLIGVRAEVRGIAKAGHVPEVVVGSPASGLPVGGAIGEWHRVGWSGAGGEALSVRLRCARMADCGLARDAIVQARRLMLTLRDPFAPTLGVTGSLLASGSRRGVQAISALGADSGGGLRRFFFEVNGQPVDARAVACALDGDVALRLRPCPVEAGAEFAAPTAAPPFIQGPNTVRVCASDFAAGDGANQVCESRAVRVDNACPISEDGQGTALDARFATNDRERLEVHAGEEPAVEGRLLGPGGEPVAGATVCVAARVILDGVAESVVATPQTDAAGRFSTRLPAGPSREVRVAYWPGSDGALERMLRLDVSADPRLRLRPRGELENGDRVDFVTRLRGPRPGGRDVEIQVRADGSWIPLRTGRSDEDGIWRSSYRFHATTAEQTYRFRAFVPRQAGYPYSAGVSPVRRKTVSG